MQNAVEHLLFASGLIIASYLVNSAVLPQGADLHGQRPKSRQPSGERETEGRFARAAQTLLLRRLCTETSGSIRDMSCAVVSFKDGSKSWRVSSRVANWCMLCDAGREGQSS